MAELSYRERIGRALEILKDELTPFVECQLRAVYKEDWKEAAGKTLSLPQAYGENKIEFDIHALLAIIWGR